LQAISSTFTDAPRPVRDYASSIWRINHESLAFAAIATFVVDQTRFENLAVSVSPNVNSPSFLQACERISAELFALEYERRLADPRYRAFLADLFRMSLPRDSGQIAERED
jgi:hypothetical protein